MGAKLHEVNARFILDNFPLVELNPDYSNFDEAWEGLSGVVLDPDYSSGHTKIERVSYVYAQSYDSLVETIVEI